MDTSADDPQTLRIQRSPSMSAPARPVKRKLSAATYAPPTSSPTIPTNSPSLRSASPTINSNCNSSNSASASISAFDKTAAPASSPVAAGVADRARIDTEMAAARPSDEQRHASTSAAAYGVAASAPRAPSSTDEHHQHQGQPSGYDTTLDALPPTSCANSSSSSSGEPTHLAVLMSAGDAASAGPPTHDLHDRRCQSLVDEIVTEDTRNPRSSSTCVLSLQGCDGSCANAGGSGSTHATSSSCLPVSSSCLAPSNPVAVAPFHNMQAYNDSPVTSEPTSLPGSPTQRESFPQLTPSASQTCQPSHHAESPSTPTFASHSFVVSSASASRSIKRLPMSRTTSALPTLRSFSSAGHPSPNATLHRRHFGGKHDQVSPSSACRSGAFSPTKRSRHISTFGSLNVRSGGLLRSPTLRQGQNGTKPGRARAGSGSHFQLRPVPAAKRRKVGERSRERGAKEVSTSSERDVRSRAAQSFGVDAESSAGEAVARGSERNMDVDVPSDAELAVKAGACSELTENGPASLEPTVPSTAIIVGQPMPLPSSSTITATPVTHEKQPFMGPCTRMGASMPNVWDLGKGKARDLDQNAGVDVTHTGGDCPASQSHLRQSPHGADASAQIGSMGRSPVHAARPPWPASASSQAHQPPPGRVPGSTLRPAQSLYPAQACHAKPSPQANHAVGGWPAKSPVSVNAKRTAQPNAQLPRRRVGTLRRSQSVPNMRSRSLLDLSAPSNHRLVLPPHLAQFIASLPQRSAAAANGGSGGLDGSSPGSALPLSAHASNAQNNLHSRLQQHRTIFTPSLHPPITRHTLRELDLCEILKNPQLRHDVVFDPNVQFRPNFDGERGRRKREAGDRYWAAVVREIEHGCTCTSSDGRNVLPCSCPETAGRGRKIVTPSAATFSRASGRAGNGPIHHAPSIRIPSRIPLLVQELRAICLSILPSHFPSDTTGQPSPSSPSSSPTSASGAGESANKAPAVGTSALYANPPWAASHHALIAQTLDPHLIAQELQHRVLDVPALVTFMGSILKLHCAPMRDEAIERMVEVVCVDGDVGKGLRMCFEILELMKLDIANHQLRSTRPYLVETAVDFEIRWFREQIEQGKLVLDRTSSWFVSALHRVRNAFEAGAGAGTTRPSNTRKMSRTTLISRAFNDGYLKLIFEPPAGVPLVGLAAISGSNAGQTGTSPSSSSLNHTYAACYPETFQFDAYRLITFHNDVTDLTIVYMLLLLFRQLACSPLSEGDASSSRTSHATFVANALNLAQRQLETVKLEIWCLLNDANLCVTSSAGKSESSTPTTSRASAAMSFEGKLFLGSAGGSAKLEDVRWRTAMRDVLLQIAARARAVQVAARDPTRASAPSVASADPPSARTIALLNAWLGTNLRTGSALYKLCQSRLRGVVLAMLVDRLSGQSPSANTNSTAAAQRVRSASPTAAVRKVPGDDTAVEESGKRVRLGDGSAVAPAASGPCVPDGAQADESTSTAADTAAQQKQQQRVTRPLGSAAAAANAPAAPSQLAAERDWEGALSKAGLEPFAAEVRLLGDRVAKVAAFHLRVFRNLYERIDCEFLPSSASSTTSASSASLASAASSAAAAALPSSSSAGSGPATGSSSPKARD